MRVVKLGGSLLVMEDLVPRLAKWLDALPPERTLLVVGGGELADGIRHLDQLHGLHADAAHWLCVEAMGLTARAVAAFLELPAPVTLAAWRGARDRVRVLDPVRFLHSEEPLGSGTALPVGWEVTSDSIAARAAELLVAPELILLKSAHAPAGSTFSDWAASGLVDRWFPQAAAPLQTVRIVNFRM